MSTGRRGEEGGGGVGGEALRDARGRGRRRGDRREGRRRGEGGRRVATPNHTIPHFCWLVLPPPQGRETTLSRLHIHTFPHSYLMTRPLP